MSISNVFQLMFALIAGCFYHLCSVHFTDLSFQLLDLVISLPGGVKDHYCQVITSFPVWSMPPL